MMKTADITQKDLENCIEAALDLLYKMDQYLICHRICHKGNSKLDELIGHVSERGIVFRFGIYFDSLFNHSISAFYNIDTEYNRDRDAIKAYTSSEEPTRKQSMRRQYRYPDLIVHQRGNDNHNLLVIEFKPWWSPNQEADKTKVQHLKDSCQYTFGATILITKERKDCKIEFI